jgi:hypothetical protein
MKSNLLNTVRAAGRGKRRGGQRAGARTKTTTLCGDYGEPMADPTPPLADSALREQVSFQRLHAHACCRVDTRAPCHAPHLQSKAAFQAIRDSQRCSSLGKPGSHGKRTET